MAKYKTRRLLALCARSKILADLKHKQERINKLAKHRKRLSNSYRSLIEENSHLKLRNINFARCLEEQRIKTSDLLSDRVRMESAYQELLVKYRNKKTEIQQLYQKFETIDLARDEAITHLIKLSESMGTLTVTSQKFLQEIRHNNENDYKNNSNVEPIILPSSGERRRNSTRVAIKPMVQGYSIHKPKVNLHRISLPNDGTEITSRSGLLLVPRERVQMFNGLNIPSPVIEEESGEMLSEAIASPANKPRRGLGGRMRVTARERNHLEIGSVDNESDQSSRLTINNQQLMENVVPFEILLRKNSSMVTSNCQTNNEEKQNPRKVMKIASPKIELNGLDLEVNGGGNQSILFVNPEQSRKRTIEDPLEGPSWLYAEPSCSPSDRYVSSNDNDRQHRYVVSSRKKIKSVNVNERQSVGNQNEIDQMSTNHHRSVSGIKPYNNDNNNNNNNKSNHNYNYDSDDDDQSEDGGNLNSRTIIYSNKSDSIFVSEFKNSKRNVNNFAFTCQTDNTNADVIVASYNSVHGSNANDTSDASNSGQINEQVVTGSTTTSSTKEERHSVSLHSDETMMEHRSSRVELDSDLVSRNDTNDYSIEETLCEKSIVPKKWERSEKRNKMVTRKLSTTKRKKTDTSHGTENVFTGREPSEGYSTSHVSSCTDDLPTVTKTITIRRRGRPFSDKPEEKVTTTRCSSKSSEKTSSTGIRGDSTTETESSSSNVSSTTRPRRAACKNKHYVEPSLSIKMRR